MFLRKYKSCYKEQKLLIVMEITVSRQVQFGKLKATVQDARKIDYLI